jgi:hypothetical protein
MIDWYVMVEDQLFSIYSSKLSSGWWSSREMNKVKKKVCIGYHSDGRPHENR